MSLKPATQVAAANELLNWILQGMSMFAKAEDALRA